MELAGASQAATAVSSWRIDARYTIESTSPTGEQKTVNSAINVTHVALLFRIAVHA